MSGEIELARLLATMTPELQAGDYVFVTLAGAQYGDGAELKPIATMQETEGLSLVVPRDAAESAGLAYDGVFRLISLRVHSSLEAVGLTAAFSGQLAARGISANVVAGHYHDHLFVPAAQTEDALTALESIT